jgi:glycosyltransferase involved in cell wall biosynthesis
MKIAIIGTRGIPNNYGGFETLAEYLALYLSRDIDVTVFCSSKDLPSKIEEYLGAKLRYVPISSHGASGVLYDSISLFQAVKKFDKLLLLGFGCGFILPFFKKYHKKFIVNIGGLDWKRSKWSSWKQRLIKYSESNLIRYAGALVADNKLIQEYIQQEYERDSVLIEYGGDHAVAQPVTEKLLQTYKFLSAPYAFNVARIQPDNNIEMILHAFICQDDLPLVMVGNWNASGYGIAMKNNYITNKSLILLDAIYDRTILDVLRGNCVLYIHGHSAGGTNPALVEAMYLGLPIYAFASGYNEETTERHAAYFKDEQELLNLILQRNQYDCKRMGLELQTVAKRRYNWKIIAQKYKDIITL